MYQKTSCAQHESTYRHVPEFDSLRGLSITIVILYHYFDTNPWFRFGWIGVDLFFTLSGFLITYTILKSSNGRPHIGNFYARRMLRTLPMYYVLLGVFMVAGPFLFSEQQPGSLFHFYRHNQNWYWSMAQNWLEILKTTPETSYLRHLWSLAVEEQFYLLWPPVVYTWANSPKLKSIISILIAVAIILRVTFYVTNPNKIELIYFNTFTRMDALLSGAFSSLLCYNGVRVRRKSFLLLFALWIGVLISVIIIAGNIHSNTSLMATIGFSLTAALFAVLLNRIWMGEFSFLSNNLLLWPLPFLGKISYSLYLLHIPLLFICGKALAKFGAFSQNQIAVCGIIVTLAVSSISYYLIEKPFLSLKSYFQ